MFIVMFRYVTWLESTEILMLISKFLRKEDAKGCCASLRTTMSVLFHLKNLKKALRAKKYIFP